MPLHTIQVTSPTISYQTYSRILKRLFALIQQRSAFPEPDNFLLTGVQKPCAIALGAAIPYLREFLAQPDL